MKLFGSFLIAGFLISTAAARSASPVTNYAAHAGAAAAAQTIVPVPRAGQAPRIRA